jgi:hypothetical protein
VFDFLHSPAHARGAALGGVNVSLADRDISFIHNNPALAGDTLNGFASAAYQFYVADVGQALFSYAHDFKKVGQLFFGIQHIGYGDIPGFDDSGIETTQYHAGETAIMVGKTHQVRYFRIGLALKGVFSNIAGYRANALVMDAGVIFKHPKQDLTIGLAIKNLGMILSDYSASSSSSVPFDVQAGMTLKPQYMPIRFSLTGYNLFRSNLLYHDPKLNAEEPSTFKKIFSHVNLAAEVLIHRNFNVMAGFNYLTHESLSSDSGGGAGVSLGFAVVVKPVEFVFSRSGYFAGNAGYSFTLSTNINKLLRRR